MRRVSPTSSVRRQLFRENDDSNRASLDNLENRVREEIERDREHMSRKYNFDFENDKPLDGNYTWSRVMDDKWIGRIKETEVDIGTSIEKVFEDISTNPVRMENENTPTAKTDEAIAPLRKRKSDPDISIADSDAKRKLSFN